MLEYYKQNRRKAKSTRDVIPNFFYNIGLILWHRVGRNLYYLRCDMKEKLQNMFKADELPDMELNAFNNDKAENVIVPQDIEVSLPEIKDEDDAMLADSSVRTMLESTKLHEDEFALLMKTFYLEEKLETPCIEGLKNKTFEHEAEDSRTITLTSSKDTMLVGIDAPGDFIYLCKYEYKREGYYKGEVLIIIDENLYQYFANIEKTEDKIKAISSFAKCTPEQQQLIINTASQSKKTTADMTVVNENMSKQRNVIQDKHAIEMMYYVCKDALPVNVQYHCEGLIKELHSSNSRKREEATMILTDIMYAYSTDKDDTNVVYPSYEECVEILKKYRYGDEELIRDIALRLRLLFRSESKGTVFCLLGKPGIGKTELGKGIAECLRRPYAEISCRDMTAVDMGGVSRIYEGGRHGKFQETLTTYGTDACILLDEFDKMIINEKDGNPYNLFDSALDDRKVYQDTYTNVPIPVKRVVLILTFNDISGIPEHIKNRFSANIFNIDSYSDKKKAEIGKQFVIPKHKNRYKFTDNEVVFTDDGLLAIASKTTDDGVREFAQKSERLLSVVNNQLESGAPAPIIVDAAFVNNYFVEINSTKKIGF